MSIQLPIGGFPGCQTPYAPLGIAMNTYIQGGNVNKGSFIVVLPLYTAGDQWGPMGTNRTKGGTIAPISGIFTLIGGT
jgi:hypothetical protein